MIRRPPRSTRMTPSFPTRRSSDLHRLRELQCENGYAPGALYENRLPRKCGTVRHDRPPRRNTGASERRGLGVAIAARSARKRSEEHTSELQSLMRISYAVFCLKKKKKSENENIEKHTH